MTDINCKHCHGDLGVDAFDQDGLYCSLSCFQAHTAHEAIRRIFEASNAFNGDEVTTKALFSAIWDAQELVE